MAGAPSQPTSGKVFLCYRREDSADIAGRFYDRLVQHFGREAVFKDVDSIPLGVDFRAYIDDIIRRSAVAVVFIGDRWLQSGGAGVSRLNEPLDHVRIEIQSALASNIPIIPLLLRNASMPGPEDLPEPLRNLAYRNGTLLRSDPHFHSDTSFVIGHLERLLLPPPVPEKAQVEDATTELPRVDPPPPSPAKLPAQPSPTPVPRTHVPAQQEEASNEGRGMSTALLASPLTGSPPLPVTPKTSAVDESRPARNIPSARPTPCKPPKEPALRSSAFRFLTSLLAAVLGGIAFLGGSFHLWIWCFGSVHDYGSLTGYGFGSLFELLFSAAMLGVLLRRGGEQSRLLTSALAAVLGSITFLAGLICLGNWFFGHVSTEYGAQIPSRTLTGFGFAALFELLFSAAMFGVLLRRWVKK
jgi:hypothetical protein